mmetsp:Transcript_17448/g.56305  ORF Transcript_17448/g.56305 Transcript_17448/m.56305 type:complete len:193 (-) Transcript_17448:214-792(-)
MTITVYYWGPAGGMNMYGRAIGIYATLKAAGVAYVEAGPNARPELSSFAPPAVDLGDGVVVGQAPACLTALGEKFNLGGATFAEKARVQQAMLDFNDIFGEHAKFVDDKERKDKWFSYLDKKIAAGGTGWAAGTASPTIADFHGVFAFEWVVKKQIDFSEYKSLTAWWDKIKAFPAVNELYASCVDGRTMIP